MMKYCISIDWLTCMYLGYINLDIFQNCKQSVEGEILLNAFDMELLKYNNRQFKHLYKVTYTGKDFATIQADPFSKVLKPDMVLIKLTNYWLYHPEGMQLFEDLTKGLQLSYHNISRVDICADFNELEYCKPEQFITKYVNREIRHKGRAKGCVHFRSTGVTNLRYNGLKFGTNESEVTTYLYNKTLEMQEEKDKPYIRDKWTAAGLFGEVWRLEVSIKSGATEYAEKETGQVIHITKELLKNAGQVKRVYHTFIDKYFSFIVWREGITNITREPVIQLFGDEVRPCRYLIRNVRAHDKSDKITIKNIYLSAMHNKQGELVSNPVYMLQTARELAENVDLVDWYLKKRDTWEIDDEE